MIDDAYRCETDSALSLVSMVLRSVYEVEVCG